MENEKPKSTGVVIKWTLIYLVASIIFTYAIQLLNLDPTSPIKYLSYVIFIVFLLLTQKEYRDQLGGFMTFGEGFMAGFMYSVYSGILSAIFAYIYLAFLNPAMLTVIGEAARAKMEEQGKTSDQIEMAVNMTVKYGAIFGAVGTVFGLIIFGVIVALIGAAIFKKERSILDIEAASASPSDPAV